MPEHSLRSVFLSAAALVVFLFFTGPGVAEQEGVELGREATDQELSAWGLNVARDGSNLPEGSGTVSEGAAVYAAQCGFCHRADGRDARLPLVGGIGSLTDETPRKTVGSYWPYATTLFDYTRRAMPYGSPKSLTDDEVYAVVAYMLSLNGIVGPDAQLDARALRQIEMPNRDGFVDRSGERAAR